MDGDGRRRNAAYKERRYVRYAKTDPIVGTGKEYTMKTRRLSVVVVALVIVAAGLLAGCETGFVNKAGRSALASFINEVITTAVDGTVNPSD